MAHHVAGWGVYCKHRGRRREGLGQCGVERTGWSVDGVAGCLVVACCSCILIVDAVKQQPDVGRGYGLPWLGADLDARRYPVCCCVLDQLDGGRVDIWAWRRVVDGDEPQHSDCVEWRRVESEVCVERRRQRAVYYVDTVSVDGWAF